MIYNSLSKITRLTQKSIICIISVLTVCKIEVVTAGTIAIGAIRRRRASVASLGRGRAAAPAARV